jgi:hypothetical protein
MSRALEKALPQVLLPPAKSATLNKTTTEPLKRETLNRLDLKGDSFMSGIDASITQQFPILETETKSPTAEEGQPAEEGQLVPPPPAEPLVATTSSTEEPCEQETDRPISERKMAANRANALLSCGPKTPEGKARSSLNAVKHGLTSRYFPSVIQAGTPEREEFEGMRTDLFEHYQPVGAVEGLLVEKITVEYMRYRRLLEREQLLCAPNRGFFAETVDRLTRYQTAINRQLFEAMRELERVQANRKVKEAEEGESGGACGVMPSAHLPKRTHRAKVQVE